MEKFFDIVRYPRLISVLEMVGYACCPADAVEQVKAVSDYIASAKGG